MSDDVMYQVTLHHPTWAARIETRLIPHDYIFRSFIINDTSVPWKRAFNSYMASLKREHKFVMLHEIDPHHPQGIKVTFLTSADSHVL